MGASGVPNVQLRGVGGQEGTNHGPESSLRQRSVAQLLDDRRPQTRDSELEDLARLRVAAEEKLREQHHVVQGDLEPATATGLEDDPLDHRCPGLEELSRQTDGSGTVVSDDAELDLEDVRLIQIAHVLLRSVTRSLVQVFAGVQVDTRPRNMAAAPTQWLSWLSIPTTP